MGESHEDWCGGLIAVTRQLASSASLDEFGALVSNEIAALGFGTIWIALVDDPNGGLTTLRETRDGKEVPTERKHVRLIDQGERLSIGEHTVMNVRDTHSALPMRVLHSDQPEWRLGLPRGVFERFRGGPFAYSPLFGSRGEPIGALGLAGYRGGEPIPDELFEDGALPILMCQLGIAIERAFHLRLIDRLENEIDNVRAMLMREPLMRTVGELATAVAHDLNNLSGTVLLALGSIDDGDRNNGHLLSRAERATRAIGDLSRRLQRMARAADGTGGHGAADLKQIVEDVATLVRPLCKESSIRLDLDLVDLGESALVLGDQALVRQAVMGLILNAREALVSVPPDRRIVEIRIARRAEEIELVVRDHGPGIPPDVQGRLFKPFVTTKPGHAGVGLASVHSAMKDLGGTVDGFNDADGGACFRLVFRLSALERIVPDTPRSEIGTQLRVLVVDDEPEFISGIRDLLRGRGYQVTSATDADYAFTLAARERFDLVLMDHGLPKKSGLDLLRALRGQGVPSKLVLMTGWDSDVVRADARASYCDRILQKPFPPSEIDQLVGDLFVKP